MTFLMPTCDKVVWVQPTMKSQTIFPAVDCNWIRMNTFLKRFCKKATFLLLVKIEPKWTFLNCGYTLQCNYCFFCCVTSARQKSSVNHARDIKIAPENQNVLTFLCNIFRSARLKEAKTENSTVYPSYSLEYSMEPAQTMLLLLVLVNCRNMICW